MPLDGTAMGAGKLAFLLRFPVGVVAGITPFNASFNLACHKIAPAIAAGNAIVHSDADVADAATLCARNSMRLAGQSCISVQNVMVHDSVYDAFLVGPCVG